MSLSQPIMNLERTDNIPQESTFVVEMGDGAGTKAVTKETLTKEMGEALKVGNLEELQTEAKSSIVAAINEAAQSGSGGSAVDILDTKEEIEANTEPGKAAGAQAVKEMFGALNDNLQGFTPVIDESTGKITGYKTTLGGADTVFPFSDSSNPTEEFFDSIYISSSTSVHIPTYGAKYFQITSNPADNYINIRGANSNLGKHLIPSHQNGITANVLSNNSNGAKLDVSNYDFLILGYGVPSSNTTIRNVTVKWFYE